MGFPKTHLFLLMNTVGSMIFGMTLTTVALQADGGNENDIEAEDHSNKQADFKPEPKNLMLSLVLFTLFPSLEQCWQRWPCKPLHRGNENDDKAKDHSNKHTKKQTNKLASNLNLKTLCFPLCFSHSSHLWNDVNDGGGGNNEIDDEAEDQSNNQTTTSYLIAVFKPEPKNLMLSLVLFTLFPSLERRQRRRRRRRRGDDENDDEAAEDLLFSAFSKTQKDLLCCHEQG